MKDVIKNYKSVIVVYAVTLVFGAGVTWYYLGVRSDIDALKAKTDKLVKENEEAAQYHFNLKDEENVKQQELNVKARQAALLRLRAERIEEYSAGQDVPANIQPSTAKLKLSDKIDLITKNLRTKIEIDPKDELSFSATRQSILTKSGQEIQIALQQLNYVEHVLNLAVEAGLQKVVQVRRPQDLSIKPEANKELPCDYFSFQFKFGGSPEAVKRLLNVLANEKGYYSRITSFEMSGDPIGEIMPKLKFPSPEPLKVAPVNAPAVSGDAQPPVAKETPGEAVGEVAKTAEAVKLDKNPPAFSKPEVVATINVDWIIFKKDQKGK